MSQAILVQQIQNIAPVDAKANAIVQTEKLVILLEEDLDVEEQKTIDTLCGLRYCYVDTPTLDIAEYFKLYDVIAFKILQGTNKRWWTDQVTYVKSHATIVSCFRRTQGKPMDQVEIDTKMNSYRTTSVRKHLPLARTLQDFINRCHESHIPTDKTDLSWKEIIVKGICHLFRYLFPKCN